MSQAESNRLSVGERIVVNSKSAFVDDRTVAEWIEYEIASAKKRARECETIRIEKMIANMTDEELGAAVNNCRQLHGKKK